jgi:hypothetical protein
MKTTEPISSRETKLPTEFAGERVFAHDGPSHSSRREDQTFLEVILDYLKTAYGVLLLTIVLYFPWYLVKHNKATIRDELAVTVEAVLLVLFFYFMIEIVLRKTSSERSLLTFISEYPFRIVRMVGRVVRAITGSKERSKQKSKV